MDFPIRNRAWRRYQENRMVIKRLKNNSRSWYGFKDANGIRIENPRWFQRLGSWEHFKYKNTSTPHSYSDRYYDKYYKYYRAYYKKEFKRILKEWNLEN